MEDYIKEIYQFRVRSYEHQVKVIENRLQFINWLFAVSSASLFGALLIIRTLQPSTAHFLLSQGLAATIAAAFGLVGIFLAYQAKKEGYYSINYTLNQLSLLDIQATIFLKEDPPGEPQDERVLKFVNDEYLPADDLLLMRKMDELGTREKGELYWQDWQIKAVSVSLLFIFVVMIESLFL